MWKDHRTQHFAKPIFICYLHINFCTKPKGHFLNLIIFYFTFLIFFFLRGGVCMNSPSSCSANFCSLSCTKYICSHLIGLKTLCDWICSADNQGKTETNASIWHENMHRYSSGNIICSAMRRGFWEQSLRETVSFEELIMSKDKYRRRMAAIVFVIFHIFLSERKMDKWLNICCA